MYANRLLPLIIIGFFLVHFGAVAQLQRVQKVELEIGNIGNNYRLIDLDFEGTVFLFINDVQENKSLLRVVKYNPMLEKNWERSFFIDSWFQMKEVKQAGSHIYILGKKNEEAFELWDLDLNQKEVKNLAFNTLEDFTITHFEATETQLILGGKMQNHASAFRYDLATKKSNFLFHNSRDKSDIQSITLDNDENLVSFFLKSPKGALHPQIYVNNYDLDGRTLFHYSFDIPSTYFLLNHQVTVMNQSELLITGAYGNKADGYNALGIYSMHLKDREVHSLKYYDFGRFKHFFKFLPKEERENLAVKIDRKRAKEKPLNIQYAIMPKAVDKTEGFYVLTANAYESIKMDGDMIFRYINTFSLGFDRNGNLRWDNSIFYPHEELVSTEPFDLTDIKASNGQLTFIQKINNIYRFKTCGLKDYTENFREFFLGEYEELLEIHTYFDQKLYHTKSGNFYYTGIEDRVNRKNMTSSKTIFTISKFMVNPEY